MDLDVRIVNVDGFNFETEGFFCYKSKPKSEGYQRKLTWLKDRVCRRDADSLHHDIHTAAQRFDLHSHLIARFQPVLFCHSQDHAFRRPADSHQQVDARLRLRSRDRRRDVAVRDQVHLAAGLA